MAERAPAARAPDIVEDVHLTRARVIANPPGTDDDRDEFLDLIDGPITLKTTTSGHGTFMYPVYYDGLPSWEFDFVPATPDGYELTDLRPFIVAHTANGSQEVIGDDTSDWGYSPPPTKGPWLLITDLTFDTFPAGSDPAEPIVCGAGIPSPFTDERYQSAVQSQKWIGEATTCDIVVSDYGWRYTFSPVVVPDPDPEGDCQVYDLDDLGDVGDVLDQTNPLYVRGRLVAGMGGGNALGALVAPDDSTGADSTENQGGIANFGLSEPAPTRDVSVGTASVNFYSTAGTDGDGAHNGILTLSVYSNISGEEGWNNLGLSVLAIPGTGQLGYDDHTNSDSGFFDTYPIGEWCTARVDWIGSEYHITIRDSDGDLIASKLGTLYPEIGFAEWVVAGAGFTWEDGLPPPDGAAEIYIDNFTVCLPVPDPDPDPDCIVVSPTGPFAENGGTVTVVGGDGALGDDSYTTYVDCEGGVVASTVKLSQLDADAGVDDVTLVARIQVLGLGSVGDPGTGFAGTAEIFLATDGGASNQEIASFSDGATSGFGFNIGSEAVGSPHEYRIPLSLTAWGNDSPSNPGGPTTLADVEALLKSDSAYLDINAVTWADGDPPSPVYRIFSATVEVCSSIPVPPGVPTNVAVLSTQTTLTLTWDPPVTGDPVASYDVRLNGGTPVTGATSPYVWTGRPISTLHDVEVRAVGETGLTSAWVLVVARTLDGPEPPGPPTNFRVTDTYPNALRVGWGAPVTGGPVEHYEVCIDRGPSPDPDPDPDPDPCPITCDWTSLSLADAEFFIMANEEPSGIYGSGTITQNPAFTASGYNYQEFFFSCVDLNPAKTYDVEVTGAAAELGLWGALTYDNCEFEIPCNGSWFRLVDDNAAVTGPTVYTIGPGLEEWDAAATAGKLSLIFEPWKTSAITSIRIREVCDTPPPPDGCIEPTLIAATDIAGGSVYVSNVPAGNVVRDVLLAAEVGGFRGVKINADGSITEGPSTAVLDPAGSGSSSRGLIDAGGPGYLTIDTAVGGLTHNLRKYTINPATLAITLQDTEPVVFSGSHSYAPVVNNIANVVLGSNDNPATVTSHDTRLVSFDYTGLSPDVATVLDSTGFTGFDIGFVFPLSATQYFTNHDRYFEVQPNGTVDVDITTSASLSALYANYFFDAYGCVPGMLFATGGDGPDQLVQVDASGVATNSDITDYIDDTYPAVTWLAKSLWTHAGDVYLGAVADDNSVGVLVRDPLGTPECHYFTEPGGAVTPVGMTTDHRFVCLNDTVSRIAVYEACITSTEPGPLPSSGCFDLSTAEFNYNPGEAAEPFGQYNAADGTIEEFPGVSGISVYFPDVPLTSLDRTKTYKFTVTFAGSPEYYEVLAYPLNTPASWASGAGTYVGPSGDQMASVVVGVDSYYAPDWNGVDASEAGMSFEFNISSTVIESICWEEFTAPADIVIDLPAWQVNGVGAPGDAGDNWSTTDTGTEYVLAHNARGGVGYFAEEEHIGGGFPNLAYMPTTPAGYTLTRATYVLIAYRPAIDDTAESGYSGYTPTPTTVPFLYGESSGTSNQWVFNDIPVGGYAGEQEWPGNEILSRLTVPGSQLPANRLWCDDFVSPGVFPSSVHVAYYAIRLYYTSTIRGLAPDAAGAAAAPPAPTRKAGAPRDIGDHDLDPGCVDVPLDTPWHLFTGLTLGTYYSLEVRAVGPHGVSEWVRINETTLVSETPTGGPVDPVIGGGPDPIFGARVHPVKYLYAMANAHTGELIAALPLTAVTYSVGMFTGQELSATVYLPDMFLEQMAHPPLNIHEHWPHPDRGIPLGSMFEVGNVAIYVIRNAEVVWGGMLWSRAYSSGDKTMAITALSWDAYVYYRALRKSVVFLNPTDKYVIWRALLNQVLHPTEGDFGWTGDAGLNSGNVSAEGGAVVPWTGIYDGTGVGNQPVTDYVERWPHNAPPIEVPPAGMVSGLELTTINESWRGYDMDNVGTQLQQFANTNNLLHQQGFDYRVLCWWDGNQAKFRQRYTFGEMTYAEGEDADDYTGVPTSIRQPLFGQLHENATNTIFDFPGHIRDWSLSESMENAATRIIVTGGGEEASKIAAYATDSESLGGTDGQGAGGWFLYDMVFNYDSSSYVDITDRANKLLSLHHVPAAAQIDDIENANSSTTQRASQASTELSVTLYVDPATTFPEWHLGDWVTFAINDPLYGGTMYLQRRIIRYSVTVLPDHESDYSHEEITLELTDDTKTEAGG